MRKIVFTNKDNVVVAVLPFNEEVETDMATIAGLLSSPQIIEVGLDNGATLGWSYINGEAVNNVN